MTNEEEAKLLKSIQSRLDETKYRQSEIGKVDLSGKMEYCKYCNLCYQHFKQCQLDQRSREANFVCAKAYNKMKEGEDNV